MEYRAHTIKAGDYLKVLTHIGEPPTYEKWFWAVFDSAGKEIANTLWFDDKPARNEGDAIEQAKRGIDEYLRTGASDYFLKSKLNSG